MPSNRENDCRTVQLLNKSCRAGKEAPFKDGLECNEELERGEGDGDYRHGVFSELMSCNASHADIFATSCSNAGYSDERVRASLPVLTKT